MGIPRKLFKMYSTQQPPAYGAQPQYNLAPMQAPVPTNNADLESGIGDLNIPKNIKEIKDGMFCYTMCILALFGPCLIIICLRADYLQRLIFCQMALNNDATGKLAWEGDNIKCDFDRSNISGFDDWKLFSDDQSP